MELAIINNFHNRRPHEEIEHGSLHYWTKYIIKFEQRIIHLVYTDIILLSIQLRRRDIIKCSSQIMLNRLKTKLLFLICSSVSQ